MQAQLSTLDRGVNVRAGVNRLGVNNHAFVEFSCPGDGYVTVTADDPAVLVAALRDAADQVERAALAVTG